MARHLTLEEREAIDYGTPTWHVNRSSCQPNPRSTTRMAFSISPNSVPGARQARRPPIPIACFLKVRNVRYLGRNTSPAEVASSRSDRWK
jgi:hypothetical protein